MPGPDDSLTRSRAVPPGGRVRRAPASGIGSAGAFQARRRKFDPLYSRFVNVLKITLPAVALLLIALVIAWPHIQKQNIGLQIGFSAIDVGETGEPSMINPRYTGSDDDGQPFTVTADLAKNLVLNTRQVELEMPKADITLSDGTWLVVTAESGIYNREGQRLDLSGAVNVFHDSGYELRTDAVKVDLGRGSAESITPVRGQGPFGELEAEGMRIIDRGRIIHFTGDATVTFYPGEEGAS